MKVLYFIAKYLLVIPFCKICFWLTVKGKKNIPKKGPYIIACNHQSVLDIVFLIYMCRRQVHFIAKKEIFKNKFIAKILKGVGIIPVDRHSMLSGYSSLNGAVEYLKKGKVVALFPQGTRCEGQNPLDTPIKSGVAVMSKWSNAVVLPVFVKTKGYKTKFFRKATLCVGEPIAYHDSPNSTPSESYHAFAKEIMEAVCSFDNNNTDNARSN